ncbi:arylesterase [Thalassococcus sp. S3]|uniref:arylesterase n=1 Tax=Thalassococcus sp. S3 TaxID=2017482 RepID=UPI0010240AE5|nr:arylesterase [Thalassococcus sp. S3]QBF30278.1 arylesterase [Thalassococcus sp. S3]
MRKMWISLVFICLGTVVRAEAVTIAALGDSLTQGYGLTQQDGFVPQLEKWLEERGAEVKLINAGVSGDTTAGGAARVAWTLTPEVDAMIVALGGNDLLRGIDPGVSKEHLREILDAARAADVDVLLVGMQAPGNYGPDFKADFDAMYPDLAATYGAVYAESFFEGLTEEQDDPAALRSFMQPDGIHPNADGVARIVEGLGPYVEALIARVAES